MTTPATPVAPARPANPTLRRALLRPLLLIQTGMLTVLTLEAAVVTIAMGAPAVTALLTATATLMAGRATATEEVTRPLVWIERLLLVTFVIDLAIAIVTAGTVPEPLAWLSRLLLPAWVLWVRRTEHR